MTACDRRSCKADAVHALACPYCDKRYARCGACGGEAGCFRSVRQHVTLYHSESPPIDKVSLLRAAWQAAHRDATLAAEAYARAFPHWATTARARPEALAARAAAEAKVARAQALSDTLWGAADLAADRFYQTAGRSR